MGPALIRHYGGLENIIKHFGKTDPTAGERWKYFETLWNEWENNEINLRDLGIQLDDEILGELHELVGPFNYVRRHGRIRVRNQDTLTFLTLRYMKTSH